MAADASLSGPSPDEAINRLNTALDGRYLVEKELGKGGMATVYLAKDVKHDREVAIKVLLPELSASIGGERFEREIKLAAKLQHPHILGLFDSGSAAGLLYYVMPFVKGESLRDRLDREKQLSVDDAIVITLEVADALGYAHKQDIVHRDIKPENIMLSGGHALVADFGIARAATEAGAQKLTQTGMAVGTPVYMSPEQAGGESVGPAADIYSLGCVLYEMLSGEPPFTGKSPMAIMARHAMETVPSIRIVRQAVPEEVEAAIFAAMGKVPADRPQTAAEFAEILGVPMSGTASMRAMGPTSTRRIPTPSAGSYGRTLSGLRAQQPVPAWKRPAVLAGAVGIVLIVAAGTYLATRGGRKSAALGEESRRVAVLYFDDASKEKNLGALADGLTESLIRSLSSASKITVISRSGVERYRGSPLAPDSIARALRAGYLVRGDVEREGGNVRANIRLDDGASGATLKRGSIVLPETNVLAMRDTISIVAGDLIRQQVGQEIQLRTERSTTGNADAWLLLQRGEQSRKNAAGLNAKADTAGAEVALNAADSLLAAAEKADAKWPDPITRRASLAYQRSRTLRMDPKLIRKWVDVGVAHADRALAIDAANPDALEVRGNLRYWTWVASLDTDAEKRRSALQAAQTDLEKAVELDHSQAGAYATLSHLYYQVPNKSTNDVYIAAERALAADEFLANANVVLGRLFIASYDLGQFDKAESYCSEARRRFPRDVRSTRCRLYLLTAKNTKPDVAEAWHIADSVVAMVAPNDSTRERLTEQMLVAAVIARASQQNPALKDSARKVAKAAEGSAIVDRLRESTQFGAFVYALLGDNENAIRLLKVYLAANPQRAISMREDPGWWFVDLAKDPRFKQAVGAGQ